MIAHEIRKERSYYFKSRAVPGSISLRSYDMYLSFPKEIKARRAPLSMPTGGLGQRTHCLDVPLDAEIAQHEEHGHDRVLPDPNRPINSTGDSARPLGGDDAVHPYASRTGLW
jgi:hypothetical protein